METRKVTALSLQVSKHFVFGILCLGISLCCTFEVKGGDSLVVEGPPVEVNTGRLYARSAAFTQLDTVYAAQHLGSALLMQTTGFIRMQSASGLATGGLQAAHTSVLWNGFNVQSPMNGVADLAVIIPATSGSISILHDAQSAFLGSGMMGPAIILNNPEAPENHELRANFSAGSFGLINTGVGFSLKHPRNNRYISTDFQSSVRHNRFIFPNRTLPGSPTDTMRHAGTSMENLHLQAGLHSTDQSNVNFYAWLQASSREIPASLTGRNSEAFQDDRAMRLALTWQYTGNKTAHEWRSAWFWQDLLYADPVISLYAESYSKQWLAEYSMFTALSPQWLLRSAVLADYTLADADDYKQSRTRMEVNTHASVKWTPDGGNFMAESGFRIPVIDGKPATFSPFINLRYKAPKGLHKMLSISKNYRHPTLNDLYWIPYGNPALEPEHAWTALLQGNYLHQTDRVQWNVTSRFNISYLENMIQWINTGASWQPVNHQAVLSRSGELELSAGGRAAGNIGWYVKGSYNLNRSTFIRHQQSHLEGQRLMWIPGHRHVHSARLKYRQFGFLLRHQFTGQRHAVADQSVLMPAFNTFDISITGRVPWGNLLLHWHITGQNLSNRYYEWFLYQPMPGRSFEAGVKATLNIHNH